MLSCKKIFTISLLILFCGCAEQKVLFDAPTNINAEFFKEMPGIGVMDMAGKPVIEKAPWLNIYEAGFSQKFIESNDLIEYTELNDSSKLNSIDYLDAKGVFSQNMYIVKYKFKWDKSTVINGAVFFTVKYHNNACVGFGPAYFGIIDPSYNTIDFTTELMVKQQGNKFWLKPISKIKLRGGYVFMPASDTIDSRNINITKIVKLDSNKVGGKKPLVFNIENILHDPNALLFHYKRTINLK